MLTMQACHQHRLVVIQPNKAKSFPTATVEKSWYSAAAENVALEARRVWIILGGHTRVSKSVDDGEIEVEAFWECCAQARRRERRPEGGERGWRGRRRGVRESTISRL